nr:hypothetical protein [Tanacetum cinerariifolium]
MPAARLTPDDNEARSDRWISRERKQFLSKYKLTSFMEQPPTTILPKQHVNKTKNKVKKANLSPLNLGGSFEDDNVEENNVTFFGSQFTGNFLIYENVNPTKVRRGNYVNLPAFLNDPHQIYLDCYMKGYIVLEEECKGQLDSGLYGEDRVRQLAMMNLAHEFNDTSTAKDELGKAYEKCRDVPLEQCACSLSTLYCLKIPHNRLEVWMVLEKNLVLMKFFVKKLL